MTYIGFTADDSARPKFSEQLSELLPTHTFFEDKGPAFSATWSSPRGLWAITFTADPYSRTCSTQIKGPGTLLELGSADLPLIAKALSAVGAVSLVILGDSDAVLDEQNGNVRPLKFSTPIGRGKPPHE